MDEFTIFSNADFLGSTVLALFTLLNLYLLIKQVFRTERQSANKDEHGNNINGYTLGLAQNMQKDVSQWRSEMKEDYKHLYNLITELNQDFQRFTNKNTEQVAALVVQNNFQQQRIHELTKRIEKVIESFFSKNKS